MKSTKLGLQGCRVSAAFGTPFRSNPWTTRATIVTVAPFTHGPTMRRTSSVQQQLSLAPSREAPQGAESCPAPPAAPSTPIVILRLPDVCRITGLCRSLVYELESNGSFPRRVPLGARSVGWVESEVQSWLAARVLARGNAVGTPPAGDDTLRAIRAPGRRGVEGMQARAVPRLASGHPAARHG